MSEWDALYTMLRREIIRFTRKPNRTILPSVISTFLYIFAFGYALGSSIPGMGGHTYIQFMLPGLIMMQVILHAYINPAYSLFSSKDDRYIEDPLTTPMRYSTMVVAYVLGGMTRGIVMGLIIGVVTMVLFGIGIFDIPMFLLFLLGTSATFACFGIMLGQWSKNIEDVGNVMSYLLSPLLFLGGVFFSIDIIPADWIRWLSWLDPLTYVVDGFRYAMIGYERTNPYYCLIAIGVSLLVCFFASLKLFESGYNLKT
ncbi:MAG TPA: ABC transporter permease [Methanocella sp.]|uniref:ABC transporter permease n=1 Tax=Methanocella sp. TaxID=2052833 RepID=UPI002CCF5EA0|nr:ABC transporter permease [Methanocella sp.]HTY91942.1 ABC transporter permease [Methanocella sp.]